MGRPKLFETSSDINVKLPKDKADLLRQIARQNGLSATDYLRTLIYVHLARVAAPKEVSP